MAYGNQHGTAPPAGNVPQPHPNEILQQTASEIGDSTLRSRLRRAADRFECNLTKLRDARCRLGVGAQDQPTQGGQPQATEAPTVLETLNRLEMLAEDMEADAVQILENL